MNIVDYVNSLGPDPAKLLDLLGVPEPDRTLAAQVTRKIAARSSFTTEAATTFVYDVWAAGRFSASDWTYLSSLGYDAPIDGVPAAEGLISFDHFAHAVLDVRSAPGALSLSRTFILTALSAIVSITASATARDQTRATSLNRTQTPTLRLI